MEHQDVNSATGNGCCSKGESRGVKVAGPGEVQSNFKISGADCQDEVRAIKAALGKIGVTEVSVNLMSATAAVVHQKEISIARIKSAIETTGVRVVDVELNFTEANRNRILLVASSGLFLSAAIFMGWLTENTGTIILGLSLASTVLAGLLVFPKALRALKNFALDMNVLMSVAVIGAFAIGEYSEGATVVFLFSLAELLEAFSVERARSAIKSVLKLAPQIAQIRLNDKIVQKPVAELKVGDIAIVKPGDNIPLDGVVKVGQSSVNQAALTGESVPVEKKVGDSVFAGTTNEAGAIEIQVTKVFEETKIARVIKMIEEAEGQRAPTERFVDSFAKVYTPAVFVMAVAVAAIPPIFLGAPTELWFYRALVLLVIACPCALVLATPISVVSGLASLARRGVLVKGGLFLETLGKLKAVALDKTGTLTEGKFQVQSFKSFSGTDENRVLEIAYALEVLSTHPLARAIVKHGLTRSVAELRAENYRVIPGRGAEGAIQGEIYFVGNHRLAHELGLCTPEIEDYISGLEAKSLSVIVVGQKSKPNQPGDILGVFGLGDSLRENIPAVIRELHEIGVNKVIVLSGDNQKTVDAICKLTGIDEGKGDLLPEHKVEAVKNLVSKYTTIAMVGDGINDAPALANASLGISMGAAGTDTAIETSDVSLMQDDLAQLPKAIRQGRRVLRVIHFNIGFAIATKLVFLVLAVAGYSNLWLAVAADLGASLLVTANALRLIRV